MIIGDCCIRRPKHARAIRWSSFHRNVDNRAGTYFDSLLAFLLIPAASGNADEHLATAGGGTVYVPVVAATRLECNVREWNLRVGYAGKIAVSMEIIGVCCVRISDGENHLMLEALFFRLQICCVGPDFFGYPERSSCVRPSGMR